METHSRRKAKVRGWLPAILQNTYVQTLLMVQVLLVAYITWTGWWQPVPSTPRDEEDKQGRLRGGATFGRLGESGAKQGFGLNGVGNVMNEDTWQGDAWTRPKERVVIELEGVERKEIKTEQLEGKRKSVWDKISFTAGSPGDFKPQSASSWKSPRLAGESLDRSRKIIWRYEDLQAYARASSTVKFSVAGGGNGETRSVGADGSTAHSAPRFEIVNVPLSKEEQSWAVTKDRNWTDLSWRLLDEVFAHCIECSMPNLVHDKHGTAEMCDEFRMDRIWCVRYCPSRTKCIERYNWNMQRLKRNKGKIDTWVLHKQHEPYLAVFRNASVSYNGEVYNDEVVFDSRGRCPRSGSLPRVWPDIARERHFKKIFVTDYTWRGTYHDLADMSARLTPYIDVLLEDPTIMIHTTGDLTGTEYENDPYTIHQPGDRLKTIMDMFGINRLRLITGDVSGDLIIAPEIHCLPNEWLFEVYASRLSRMIHRYLVENGYRAGLPFGEGTILVIKRSGTRRINNHDELIAGITKEFRGKRLEVYDDVYPLSTKQIWGLFYSADVVVAPHGAGLTNMLAVRRGTVVYEFLQPHQSVWDPADINLCYRDLAIAVSADYYGDFPKVFHRPSKRFDIKKMEWEEPPTSMTVDVPTTMERLKRIMKDRGIL
ncbi:hypothetical protein CBR_g55879 [Chara braunii]|uniref:Glycosyltransferase 61 catalytic domain-containing protein n=1 Tax=Chara braunii TaxID=69332 RepID=A0A388MDA5_CHABU|nr:hypothetical protein CBR_g55879 [Chara braunii]|eukprot:GBG92544.1 hypothetical protein CBR_g55879 [Chara braunii]